MLGGGESKLLAFVDDASSAALMGLEILDVFEAKSEAVRLAEKVFKGFAGRLRGLNALTRSERVAAAHWIIAITAFFEAADECLKSVGIEELGASAGEQVALITRTYPSDASILGMGRVLSGHSVMADVEPFYGLRAERFIEHLQGLAVFESLDDAQRRKALGMRETLSATAVLRYRERLRELADDVPEFNIWLNLSAHEHTAREVRRVNDGLARLESLLTGLATTDVPHGVRGTLCMAYRAQLDKAITQQAASDLVVPTLGEGYVEHRFRVAASQPTMNPAAENWWREFSVFEDLDLYLASYLVSDAAKTAPLLVLGQPGSGKSVLTRILAARLPAERFLPIRVELRSVDADADLQTQIEEAVRQVTTESVRWPDLVREAPEAMPVVLLDGFDELLQATGVARTDFLERVSRFQEREIDNGRAVAVVVTSRIAVADRARVPAGTVVMCLEPFDDRQVEAWLTTWAGHNEGILAARGLRPLTAEVALRHRQLAAQPLMLLMLALYDASANALRGAEEDFSEAALYEALLTDFARREVEKHQTDPVDDAAVEQELARLSVVAFAMFNRRAQWATDEDVTADLTGLRMAAPAAEERRMQRHLTAGQLAVGRFFFIHDTQAMRDGTVSQTYEFLHATFGEFLIARFVARLTAELAEARGRASTLLPAAPDDGWLHALLSFECLAARTPVITFLSSLVARDRRLTDLLLELFATSLDQRSDTRYSTYRPVPITAVQRHANWSANLMLLAAISADGIMAGELFGGSAFAAAGWRDTALLWRGQLTSEGRNGLIGNLHIERTGENPDRDLRISVSIRAVASPPLLDWTYNLTGDDVVRPGYAVDWMRLKDNFTAAKAGDVLLHGLEPIAAAMPEIAHMIVKLPDRPPMTASHALLGAIAALADPRDADKAMGDLLKVMEAIAGHGAPTSDLYSFLAMSLGTLYAGVIADVVPKELYEAIHRETSIVSIEDDDVPARLMWQHLQESLRQLLAGRHTLTEPDQPASAASPAPAPSPTASSPETPATTPGAP
ncbi:hypothetical protein GCM10009838_30940 [Catenulispora subtropica]|uniref:AAA+ ATPase domain-containing protein n=2 Tax=Catenulispora subtropica TaxID=450798 RepID=A0ABN2RK28_9ACTN